MKQRQFRGSARSVGFRPINVGSGEIARMREESNRVAQGMREARDSEAQERARVLNIMKENQRAEKADRARNQQIQVENYQKELTQIQLDAQAQSDQFRQNQKDLADFFGGIAEISQTAQKAYDEVKLQRDKDEAHKRVAEFLKNPDQDSLVLQVLGEGELQSQEELRQGEIDAYEFLPNSDDLTVQKARSASSYVRYELDKARLTYMLEYLYPQKFQQGLLLKEEQMGRPLSASETAAYTEKFRRGFTERVERLLTLKPEALRTGYETMNKFHLAQQRKARDREAKELRAIQVDKAETILSQNPKEFTSNAVSSFRTWARAEGRTKALDRFQDQATKRDPNGEYLFTMEQLASVDLKGNGKTFCQEWPGRCAEMKRQRLRDDNQFRQAQLTADALDFKESTARSIEYLQEQGGGSEEQVDQMIKFQYETFNKIAPELQKHKASYTIEAKAKAKQIEALENIPDGFITQEAVDALQYLDPTAARELDARFSAQERRYKGGAFKAQSDSFKGVANGVTSFGTNKPNTPSSVFLQQQMRAEFRRRVDFAVAEGADFNAAANRIGQELAREVKDGARDPESKWFRKTAGRGGGATFPNLTTGNVSKFEAAKRNYANLMTSINDNGLEATLDTPESIITKDEAQAIIQGYGKPGFTIPRDVAAVAGMTKGADPFTIINRQLRALGMPELDPPELTKSVGNNLSPEELQNLYSVVTGKNAKMRTLHEGANRVTGVNNFRNASNFRKGSRVLAYISGNIGPTSTGPHLDVKQVGRGEFRIDALDDYVEVDDPELGTVPLSKVPITGDFASHTVRGSHGIDYGLYTGTKVYVKNGATIVGTQPSVHGDVTTIALPNGLQYTFLHGTAPEN